MQLVARTFGHLHDLARQGNRTMLSGAMEGIVQQLMKQIEPIIESKLTEAFCPSKGKGKGKKPSQKKPSQDEADEQEEQKEEQERELEKEEVEKVEEEDEKESEAEELKEIEEEENSPEPAPEDKQAPTSNETSETEEEAKEDAPKVSKLAWEEFQLLNDLRAQGFTCPAVGNAAAKTYAPNSEKLRFDCNLWKASRAHSEDMAKNNYFSHMSQGDGTSPGDRATEKGYEWTAIGENIAAGGAKAEQTLEQWKTSTSGHCDNMMNPRFKDVAIGYAFDQSATYKHYWTEKFGTTGEESTDTSCYP